MTTAQDHRPPARLVPDEPLPPYTFVPGRRPHPVSDPAGHSYGRAPAACPPLVPEQWWQSRTYLYGIDLFNAGYYWESHVAFEALWLAAGRRGAVADFLKGLIKLAAAGVKHLEGTPAGVYSHTRRAAELFEAVARQLGGDTPFLGLSPAGLGAVAQRLHREGWPTTAVDLRPRVPETTVQE